MFSLFGAFHYWEDSINLSTPFLSWKSLSLSFQNQNDKKVWSFDFYWSSRGFIKFGSSVRVSYMLELWRQRKKTIFENWFKESWHNRNIFWRWRIEQGTKKGKAAIYFISFCIPSRFKANLLCLVEEINLVQWKKPSKTESLMNKKEKPKSMIINWRWMFIPWKGLSLYQLWKNSFFGRTWKIFEDFWVLRFTNLFDYLWLNGWGILLLFTEIISL